MCHAHTTAKKQKMKRKKEQTSKGSEHCSPLLQPRCCSQQYPAQHATHLHLYYSFSILLLNPRWSPKQHKRSITLCSSSSAAKEQSSTNLMCITSSSLPFCSQFLQFPQECATISLSPIPKKTLQQVSDFVAPFLPFASCATSFSKDHFFVRKGSFSSSKLLPSSPSKFPFSLSHFFLQLKTQNAQQQDVVRYY